jgi:hypothetical protein
MFKYYFLLSFFVGILLISCTTKNKFERTIFFDRNLVNTKAPELVCQLSEDSILLREIQNFTLLSDTSFIVVDGKGVYLYHISGTFKKQFGKLGQAGGELISPTLVYATSDFVYVWCTSLMKFLIFDHEGNFKDELSGFKKAIKKFVVNSSDEILYLYTSGIFDESENKMIDVIDVYNIAEKTLKKYGERTPEDEVLSTFRNSGGLYIDTDMLIYLHPGNLIIHGLNLKSDKTVQYKIDDKVFYTKEITSNIRDVMENMPKLIDYLHKNSIVKGIYKYNGQYIIFSEIGQYDFNEQTRVLNTQKRKIKLYILDSFFNPNCTILFDYISSPNIVIDSNSLYFITLMDSDDQIFALNRFSLEK